MKGFASDNYAGVLPQVMLALQQANEEHAVSYGDDVLTARVKKLFHKVFETEAEVVFVFNGTGANVLSMSAALNSFQSVLCSSTSHFYNDESTAPESFTGGRFIPIPANGVGKLEVSALEKKIIRKGDIHFAQPKVVTITQSTEYGTVYSPEEIKAISELARKHGLYLHVDGSRFFNAAASLKCSLAAISTGAGVDILSLGGTKLGMMYGEAVVVFNKELAEYIRFKQKQVMQLASKTRFIAAQFEAVLQHELWRETASHANTMARQLYHSLKDCNQVEVTMPVEANVVFAKMPAAWIPTLQSQFPFYIWDEATNEVRLMCAFDTTEEEVKQFETLIKSLQS
ncbi:MAG TPA: low specificity L-threonine aldolase [Flavipsychrobacter sp.]|nr:low specificity L-threonine aldolase [Flavipsychrobacter sp.]